MQSNVGLIGSISRTVDFPLLEMTPEVLMAWEVWNYSTAVTSRWWSSALHSKFAMNVHIQQHTYEIDCLLEKMFGHVVTAIKSS